MVKFTHFNSGTPEQTWEAAQLSDRFASLRADDLKRLVVVSAHPDDESLGVGGLIAHVAARGLPIVVVVLSNGEASHPQSSTHDPARLAQIRRLEVTAAIAHLAPHATIHLLDLPDGKLGEHAETSRRAIAEAIGERAESTWVVAPWRADGHPDHAAASAAAAEATEERHARLFEYPIWAWHWSTPKDEIWDEHAIGLFDLTPAERAKKAHALSMHHSQVRPLSDLPGDEAIVPEHFLVHFARGCETLIEVDEVSGKIGDSAKNVHTQVGTIDATLTASYFDGVYSANPDPWGFETRWYEKRKRAALIAALPRQHFENALELGCSIGVLTEELATRCDFMLGVDVVEAPLDVARKRLEGHTGVRFERRTLPEEWPDGRFDLIVLSEVGYYFSIVRLRSLLEQCRASMAPGGVLIACHWRHLVEDYPITGDAVHACLTLVVGLQRTVHHAERDFILEVYEQRPAQSVAQRAGLVS